MARYRRNRQASPAALIFCSIVMVIMAVVIFRVGSAQKKETARCTGTATGTVTSVREERRTKKSGKHSRTTYYVYITDYTFDVNGTEYTGFSTLSASERHNVGDTITVKYNPDKPSEEHRTPYDASGAGSEAAAIFVGIFGVIFFFAGIKAKADKARGIGVGAQPISMRQAAVGAILGAAERSNNNNSYNNNYNNNYSNTNSNFNNGYNNNSYNNNSFDNGYNNNNSYNSANGSYSSFNSNGSFNDNGSFGNSFGGNNGYNNGYGDNNYNNGYSSNNYNNGYNNNNYNNNYNNGFGGSDFNQLN